MNLSTFVALRYLRSQHRPLILRIISWLSVVGVAAGVATLVIALAMNTGFRTALEDRLLAVTAHVHLTRPGSDGIRDYNALADHIASQPHVVAAVPALYQTVLLTGGGKSRGVVLKGIEPQRERSTNSVLSGLLSRADLFAADADGLDAVVLGGALAEDLRIAPGEYVTLTGPQGRLTPFGMLPRSRRFRVAAIFHSGFYDYDSNWGFVTMAAAQGLAGVGDLANVIECRLERPDLADGLAPSLAAAAGPGFVARTWSQENRALFRALRLEKLVTAIFIGLITFVAGLNILVVLAMTVREKARDIAVLMAMGARANHIRQIFVLQGLLAGLWGTVAGSLVGFALAWAANHWRLVGLDPEVYAISYVPFSPSWSDAFWITLAALGICTGATIYPARQAARLSPTEILRYE
ncbi:MAG TPA: ABC transporter permease [Candidatus Binatia bacterium]|nr:ABC transporter permease [Candidatus Binatia bacterium]